LPKTSTRVPEVLGGVLVDGEVRYGIEVPLVASLLAGLDPDTQIQGLDAIPPDERPADRLVNTVHMAFQVMVGIGTALLGLAVWGGFSWLRHRRLPRNRLFLACTAVSGLAAVVALEAGWVVTEVGRQPWTIVGLLRTRDAAPTTGNLWPFFGATVVLYAAIAFGTFYVLRLLRQRWRSAEAGGETAPGGEADVPYGPSKARTADLP
jgi:cytochrome d ubiquinol oxidase subunit I